MYRNAWQYKTGQNLLANDVTRATTQFDEQQLGGESKIAVDKEASEAFQSWKLWRQYGSLFILAPEKSLPFPPFVPSQLAPSQLLSQ